MPTIYSPSKAIQVEEFIDMKYFDRGDPADADFSFLTIDGAYHELDLSGLVPTAGANHLVHLAILTKNTTTIDAYITFREIGNVNEFNQSRVPTQVLNTDVHADRWVMMNADRKIEYKVSGTGADWATTEVTVRGWWID